MKAIIIAAAVARLACAWVESQPAVTDAVAMNELGLEKGFSPKPTTAPIHRDLLRRQAATQILGYLAPDNTCGYVDGRIGGVKTCDPSENCAAVLGADQFYTMGCCGTGQCVLYGSCYPYASMSACDHACQQDANIVKCSGTAHPYCYGYSVPGMSMGFYSCDSTTASTFDVFETTFVGESPTKSWLALRATDFSSLLSSGTTTALSSTARTTTSTSGNNAPSSTSSATTSSSSATGGIIQQQQQKSTPIGAIVGGVVGGVVALGAIVGAVVFFLMRNKRQNKQAAGTPAPGPGNNDPHMSQYGAPNGPPSGGPGYYQQPNGAGNTTSTYFAGGPGKMQGSDAKYDSELAANESHVPGVTPVSPAPAYSGPMQHGPPPPQMGPSPVGSPQPSIDPRFSTLSEAPAGYPPQGYAAPHQGAPAHQPGAPAELGSTFAVPTQHQGRPVYEAA